MMLRVNLIFCVISLLWTSVFGTTYTIYGSWEARLNVCHDDDAKTNTHIISDQTINNLPYNFFNKHTIIKAHGFFVVKSAVVKPIATHVLLLNEYHDQGHEKIYEGQRHLVGYDWLEKHITHVGIRLIIPKHGVPRIRNYVYAGAWHAEFCAYAISNIELLKIVQ